jgi:hypothetical protein
MKRGRLQLLPADIHRRRAERGLATLAEPLAARATKLNIGWNCQNFPVSVRFLLADANHLGMLL